MGPWAWEITLWNSDSLAQLAQPLDFVGALQ